VPFNAISLNVTTATSGAQAPTVALRYSNTAGTGWTNLTNTFALAGGGAHIATGEAVWVFAPPSDWGKSTGGGSLGTNIPDGFYAINVRATTAPTTAGVFTGAEICRLYFMTEAIADNATLSLDLGAKDFAMGFDEHVAGQPAYGDGLVAAFVDIAVTTNGTKADVGNRVTALVSAT